MTNKLTDTGPFGYYTKGGMGHILNNLYHLGIPLHIVGSVTVDNGNIHYADNLFAQYKYFDGIDQPLFRFQGNQYQNLTNPEGDYVITLGAHDNPSLVLTGPYHVDDLTRKTINRALTNYMPEPFYLLHKNAGAFLQGNGDDFLYVEFWKPAGAQAWLDAFNNVIRAERVKKETLPEL